MAGTYAALVTIADIDTVKAVMWVNETQIAQLHDSMTAVVTVDAYPDTSFTLALKMFL